MSGVLLAAVGNSYGYKPINTVAPAITGTAQARQTLTCSTGTWNAAPLPITYAYQWYKNGSIISGATNSTYVVLSADVGSTLKCTVTASNAVGATSADSNTTATVIANVPLAPTIGTATATGSSTATVAFTAPTDNGGATITSYTAVSSPGGITATGASSPITVTGLSPSTSYTFVVYATNSVGNSANSASSNTITTQEAFWFAQTNNTATTANTSLAASGTNIAVASYFYTGTYGALQTYALNNSGTPVYGKIFGANATGQSLTSNSPVYANETSTTYAAGFTRAFSTNPQERAVVVGVNSSGSTVYSAGIANSLNTAYNIGGVSLTTDSGGNVYLGGATPYSGGVTTRFVAKLNSSGSVLWASSIASGSGTGGTNNIGANTSYVAVAAQNSSWSCPYLINSSTGVKIWGGTTYRPNGSTGGTTGRAAVVDSSGNSYFAITGNFNGITGTQALLKFNSSGTFQWGIATTITSVGSMTGLTLGSDGFLYFSGGWDTSPSGTSSQAVVKVNSSGSVIWSRRMYSTTVGSQSSNRVAVIGSSYYYLFALGGGGPHAIAKLPTDGSKTGTYGTFVYDTSGPSFTTASLTSYSSVSIVNDTTFSTFSPGLPETTFTPTSSITNV
jgi:hypothetical protein